MILKENEIIFLKNLVKEAGMIAKKDFEKNISISYKEDRSPVTETDLKINKFLNNELKKKFKFPIISEENTKKINFKLNESFFLLDPLDGTKEFISGVGEFTINIALIINNFANYGFINYPKDNLTYWNDEFDAYLEIDDKNYKLKRFKNVKPTLRVLVSRSHLDKKTNFFLNKLDKKRVVKKGSSIKICLLASNDADLYIRYGKTMEWDIAAGHSVLKKVGGNILDFSGSEIIYNKLNFFNCEFIALRNDLIFKDLYNKFF